MKINHNMSAVVTNAQLLKTEGGLAASMERLSSGLKINHAKDDPAGMAIMNKMQAQIDGLAKASEGASNGISVLQIADSALGEITDMLQRMRELSVQAATDTNQDEERGAIQQEIDSLIKEVDRISRDTEYNTKKLLDGSSDTRVYGEGISRTSITDTVGPGEYHLTVDAAATQATAVAQVSAPGTNHPSGTVVINGVEIAISADDDEATLFQKLRDGAEKANVTLLIPKSTTKDLAQFPATGGFEEDNKEFEYGDSLAFVSNAFGAAAAVEITCSDEELEKMLGLDMLIEEAGEDATVSLDLDSSFGAQAVLTTDGNKFKVTDRGGFEMNFVMDPGKIGDVEINVTDIGTMTLQIGANEHQTMQVRIPEVSSRTLYLDEVNVRSEGGAGNAISQLDQAISYTSGVRSAIGAYQNRLEYAVDSLDASGEDMTNAISRIGDTDMAKEMSEYTKYTVLQQAGTSVLAQANDIPQTVLQLLQ